MSNPSVMGPDRAPIVSVETPGYVRVRVNRVVMMSGQTIGAGMTCMLKPEDAAEVVRRGAGELAPDADPVPHSGSPVLVEPIELPEITMTASGSVSSPKKRKP